MIATKQTPSGDPGEAAGARTKAVSPLVEIRYYLSQAVNQYQRAHAHQGRGQEDGFDLLIERCGILPTVKLAQGDAGKTQQGEIMHAQRDRDQDEDGPGVLE